MNDDRRYELISAYLDDELTPAEQAEVEQLLAEDASARQLYQELRALSETLRALPRHELDEAFADQVLRRAERTVLTQPTSDDASSSSAGSAGWLSRIPFGRNPRSWGWAAAAIAAAVLLMIFNPQQEPEHVPVARHAPKAGDAEMSALKEPAAQEQAATEATPEAMMAAPQTEEAAEDRVADSASRDAAPQAELRVAEEGAAEMAPPPAAAMQAPRMMMQRGAAPPAQAEMAADAMMESAPTAEDPLAAQLAQLSNAGVMVVQIDVTPEAIAQGALEEILTRQSISLDQPPAEKNAQPGPQADAAAEAQQGQQAKPFAQRSRKGQQESKGAFAPSDEQQAAETPLQMVYLEAAPEVVEATLADLAARPQDFPAIDVEPAPGIMRQQALSSYTRGEPQQELQLQKENAQPAAPLAMRKSSAGQAQKAVPFSADGAAAPRPQAFSAAEPRAMRGAPLAAQSQQQRQALGRAQRVRTPQEIQQAPLADAASNQADKPDQDKRENETSDMPPSEPAATAQGQMRVLFLLRVQAEDGTP